MFYQQNENNYSCIEALNAKLEKKEKEIHMLEDKVAKHNRTKAEVCDLNSQLHNLQQTIDYITENQEECYNNICRDLDKISMKYKRTSNTVKKLKQENYELQCSIQSKTSREIELNDSFKKLEIAKTKAIECYNGLQDKINKEQEYEKALKHGQAVLEKAIVCKTEEAKKLRCDLTDAEETMQCKNKKLCDLQQWNTERDQILRESVAKCKEREAVLSELKASGVEQLAGIDRSTDAFRKELADVTCTVADWRAKCERATKAYGELKEASDAETCRGRAAVKELSDKGDRLTARLSEATDRLTAVTCDNRRLTADLKAEVERLECLTAEVNRLEQQVAKERVLLSLHQTKQMTELSLLAEEKVVKGHKLTLAENEVKELKKTLGQADRVFRETKQKLAERSCSIYVGGCEAKQY